MAVLVNLVDNDRVRVWVSPPILEDQSILKLIKCQELGAENWAIIRGSARDKSEGKVQNPFNI